MKRPKHIESLQNQLVKKVLRLKEKKRGRSAEGLFVLEGMRELKMALIGGYSLNIVLYCEPIIPAEKVLNVLSWITPKPEIVSVSKEVYQRLAYREKTEGVLAIANAKSHHLQELEFKRENPLILVAESPEKPGNLGALLRTADAADLDAVILANPKGDLYNPNVIRSSVGCLFTVPIGIASNSETIDFLKKNSIQTIAADLSASKKYTDLNLSEATAIIVGTESTGLTDLWLKNADEQVLIPMQGEIDSMNVSVSAAILIFEAKRQRSFY